jgi:hypothetical protein
MGNFQPTHKITTERDEIVEVMLTGGGAAYQRCEWDAVDAADYEQTDDGRWLFQGQPFTGAVETLADRTQRLYRDAEARVRGDDRLAPHAATILDDHGEGDDHWQWVVDADTDEIVAWVEGHQ